MSYISLSTTTANIHRIHLSMMMMTLEGLLLWAGVVYFLFMSAAHATDFKVPGLFVYFDVPSKSYQNKIIAFTCLTYATLFAFAASRRDTGPAAISILTTALGLAYINVSDALRSEKPGKVQAMLKPGVEIKKLGVVMKPGVIWYRRDMLAYWVQTVMIGGYGIILAMLYVV